jgi:hypothetical protein
MEPYAYPRIDFTGPPPFDTWLKGERLARPPRWGQLEKVASRLLLVVAGIVALAQVHGVFLTVGTVLAVVGLIVAVGVLEKKCRLARARRRYSEEAAPPSGVVSEDGLRDSAPPHVLTDWAQFQMWQADADLLVLHTPCRRLVFAPTMFRSQGEWSSFRRMVQQYVRQG